MKIEANTSLISSVDRSSSNIKAINTYQSSELSTVMESSAAIGVSSNSSNREKTSYVMTEKSISTAVDKINEQIKLLVNNQTQLEFAIHEQTGKISVKIIDANTKEVIKQIPSEKTLDRLAEDWAIEGLLMDKKL